MSDIMAELNENVRGLRQDVADLTASLNMFATKSDVESILLRRVGRVERQLLLRARRRFATFAASLVVIVGLATFTMYTRTQVVTDLCEEINNTNGSIIAILERSKLTIPSSISDIERESRTMWLQTQIDSIDSLNC